METSPPENVSERPHLNHAQSFPRMDGSAVSPFARTRAKTVQSTPILETEDSDKLPLPLPVDGEGQSTDPDVFEKRGSLDSGFGDEGHEGEEVSVLSWSIHEQPEELPIELMSLTDR